MMRALEEIEIRPQRIMRKAMIWGALIGAIAAAISLIAMSYLGLIAENDTLAAMEAHLDKAWIEELPEGRFLIVPNANERLFTCGTPSLPCIRLEE